MSRLITQWCERHRLPGGAPADGAPRAVTVDRLRLRLSPLAGDGVLVEARLASLPLAGPEQERLLDQALRHAAPRLPQARGALVVDASASALWLQGAVAGAAGVDGIDDVVEALVNEVEQWRKVL